MIDFDSILNKKIVIPMWFVLQILLGY